ncbi:Haloacid dehalogenase-like hydrolase superfamily protein [Prunus dulcis]|uniref:Haloacid dehalogenase-like hydrolase superfamily protein n=1 Tax=Prunus dulcis TaxID=3755 RepID=A0A4Y1RD09_PRUDU|nr:Haloacid dehalogenase-like hydrolase superfamily protein [Prunus dulcis]
MATLQAQHHSRGDEGFMGKEASKGEEKQLKPGGSRAATEEGRDSVLHFGGACAGSSTLFVKLSLKEADNKRECRLALSMHIRTRSSLILIIQLHQDLKILDDDINMRAGSLSGTIFVNM